MKVKNEEIDREREKHGIKEHINRNKITINVTLNARAHEITHEKKKERIK